MHVRYVICERIFLDITLATLQRMWMIFPWIKLFLKAIFMHWFIKYIISVLFFIQWYYLKRMGRKWIISIYRKKCLSTISNENEIVIDSCIWLCTKFVRSARRIAPLILYWYHLTGLIYQECNALCPIYQYVLKWKLPTLILSLPNGSL